MHNSVRPLTLFVLSLAAMQVSSACGRRTVESPEIEQTKKPAELDQTIAIDKAREEAEAEIARLKKKAAEDAENKALSDMEKAKVAEETAKQLAQKEKELAELERLKKEQELAAAEEKKRVDEALKKIPASSSGFYLVRYSDPDKNDCVDVPAYSKGDNVQLLSYPCNTNQSNQQFALGVQVGTSLFSIKGRDSGKCLAPSALTENASIVQVGCANVPAQQWDFVKNPNDYLIKNKSSGKCIKITSTGSLIQGDCVNNFSFFTLLSAP